MSQEKPHPDWKVVTDLGGASKVAAMLGTSIQRVQNWKIRGIPPLVKLQRPDLFLPSMTVKKQKARV